MRPIYEKIIPDPERSFHVAGQALKEFDAPWHFHPEIELTWIVESRGRRFVGDSIAPFQEGELVLLGKNLPHFWQNDGTQQSGSLARSVVVQFSSDFLGDEVWSRKEFQIIQRLLGRASRGLLFSRGCRAEVCAKMQMLTSLNGMKALVCLLDCLDRLAMDRNAKVLASIGYAPDLDRRKESRLARVFEFATLHFRESVSLPQLAEAARMSPAAFSRYFKRATGRAPSDFLNDLRIEYASRLLRETTRTVADIAADTGYSTLTNFNRRFRERVGMTPSVYRKLFEMKGSAGNPGARH